jgi:hypothetical protein
VKEGVYLSTDGGVRGILENAYLQAHDVMKPSKRLGKRPRCFVLLDQRHQSSNLPRRSFRTKCGPLAPFRQRNKQPGIDWRSRKAKTKIRDQVH